MVASRKTFGRRRFRGRFLSSARLLLIAPFPASGWGYPPPVGACPQCIVAGAPHGSNPFPSIAFCTWVLSSSAVRSGSIWAIGLSVAASRMATPW